LSISDDELIRLCAESNDELAWEEFIARFDRAISLSVIRTVRQWGVTESHVVDDLVQETYLKLCAAKCRLLQDFAALHPETIPSYIKTIAINVVHDHFKALHSTKRGSGKLPETLEDIEAPAGTGSLGSSEAIEREVLLQEVGRYLEACTIGPDQERDRLVFWLYYRQGMTAQAIADLPGIALTSKGVESAILRMTRLVRQRLIEVRKGKSSTLGEKGFRPAESY